MSLKLLNKYFVHYDKNLNLDSNIPDQKKENFHHFLDNFSPKIVEYEKEELVEYCNIGFFWVRDPVTKGRINQLIGPVPKDWDKDEVIGRTVLLDTFLENFINQNPNKHSIPNLNNAKETLKRKFRLLDFRTLPLKNKQDIIRDFKLSFGKNFLLNPLGLMWSFRSDKVRSDFATLDVETLPRRLGLIEYERNDYICFTYRVHEHVRIPTCFDAGLENLYFLPGGRTKPVPPVSHGLEEIVHEPNKANDLIDFI